MTYPKRPLELYTYAPEQGLSRREWQRIISSAYCQYLEKECDKVRKSQPDVTLGTCTVGYMGLPIVICPHRLLQQRQIFTDVLHLLEKHTPGNQLHVVPEIAIPGGNVDYFVCSVQRAEIKDYVAVEIQTLDTTGTVWLSRQELAQQLLKTPATTGGNKGYGMNWKMTAKTILMQLHHKAATLELMGKKLTLVVQDVFYEYLTRVFSTSALRDAETADSVHFHVYGLAQGPEGTFSLELRSRTSTTTVGLEQMLGLRQSAQIAEEELLTRIQAKIGPSTLLKV